MTTCVAGLVCILAMALSACNPDTNRCEQRPSVNCDADEFCLFDGDGSGTCTPLRERGESCRENVYCRDEMVCADGVCQDPAAEGERCRRTSACADGLACNVDVLPARCEVTPTPGRLGQQCGTCADGLECAQVNPRLQRNYCVPEGVECSYLGQGCADGICLPGPGEPSCLTCQALKPDGSPCSYDRECEGSICLRELEEPVCGRSGGLNGPCQTDAQCVVGQSCDYDEGRCVPSATLNACGGQRCGAGEYCDASEEPPTCRETARVGDVCLSDAQCDNSFCDEQAEGPQPTCQAYRGVGGACQKTTDCLGGLTCTGSPGESTCQPQRDLGERCSRIWDCRSGLSCDLQAEPPVCERAWRAGVECVEDLQCEVGLTCHGGILDHPICHDRTGVDSECVDDRDCTSSNYCGAGRCTPRRQVGDACERDGVCVMTVEVCEGERCFDDPVVCHSQSGICELRGEADEPCGVDEDCGLGYFCATTLEPSVCREQLAPGEPCDRHRECGPVMFCGGGTCHEPGTCSGT